MTEKEFQGIITDLAKLYRWRAYHTFDSRRSAAGFPDLVLVRPPELLFVELKTDSGKLSPEQEAWLEDLAAVAEAAASAAQVTARVDASRDAPPASSVPPLPAVEAHVWRPAELSAIQSRLCRRPTPQRREAA